MVFKNTLDISHKIIKDIVTEGDIVVDATAGNGNDTLLLSQLVGDAGKVYAFDIQDIALENTRERLKKGDTYHRVQLIKDGHQNMEKYVSYGIKAVLFNLGYLPGGDHSISTRPKTTIAAIEAALRLLKVGGIIMMVIYYGGDSGFSEKDAVLDHIKSLDYKEYSVLMMDYINWINCPPIAVIIQKNSN